MIRLTKNIVVTIAVIGLISASAGCDRSETKAPAGSTTSPSDVTQGVKSDGNSTTAPAGGLGGGGSTGGAAVPGGGQ